jgi:hypothetical protein
MHHQLARTSLRREAVTANGQDESRNAKENQRSLHSRAKNQGHDGQGDHA